MRRERYKDDKDEEENESEWLIDVNSKIGHPEGYEIDDLQDRRDAKPQVGLEAKDLSYSVEGVVTEMQADEENQVSEMEGGARDSSLSDMFEEEEDLKDTEENEFGNVSLLNRCGTCLTTRCSCCPCCPSKMDVKLLDGISMKVEPGMMMALMGPSGAGKCLNFFLSSCFPSFLSYISYFFFLCLFSPLATLMDVIAGRKTGGEITGSILFNGRERDEFFSRYTGYCEQVPAFPFTSF